MNRRNTMEEQGITLVEAAEQLLIRRGVKPFPERELQPQCCRSLGTMRIRVDSETGIWILLCAGCGMELGQYRATPIPLSKCIDRRGRWK
jgi:hypothetical protein